LYMNLESRPRDRWQDEVREDGRSSWEQQRNRHILHVPMEWMNINFKPPTCCSD
jgi:hypothetical protein